MSSQKEQSLSEIENSLNNYSSECEGCLNDYPSLKDHSCAEKSTEYLTIKTLLNYLLSGNHITQAEYIKYCTELELKFYGSGSDQSV